MPQAPAGMQRPGIPGAGNILDPAVRAEIREKLHPAVHDAGQLARGQRGEPKEEAEKPAEEARQPAPAEADTPEARQPAPPAQGYRAGPYPHGDVDLRTLPANVPAEPVRPRRGRAGRRFYFLTDQATASSQQNATPAPTTPPGPKPG
jgi:hypothetical protein